MHDKSCSSFDDEPCDCSASAKKMPRMGKIVKATPQEQNAHDAHLLVELARERITPENAPIIAAMLREIKEMQTDQNNPKGPRFYIKSATICTGNAIVVREQRLKLPKQMTVDGFILSAAWFITEAIKAKTNGE